MSAGPVGHLVAVLRRGDVLPGSAPMPAAGLAPAGFGSDEVSLSLGVASAGGPAACPLELMSRADQQLYRAKITRNAVGAPPRALPVPS